ncbi:hypothetical protein HOLleu_27946 [Holothuria leucospilota]|uniref:Uncharacterized protein n=1 Tax=Holothuria leucospilota TaxID=206669 RepID=A0A9Q1BRA8_HOLLE|nr:hypothetical protein HOLleu_27946 [Holothuria leucospilota]
MKVPQVSHSGVTLLIGQDVPDALVPLEVRNGRYGKPYATRTVLGWTLNGPLRGDNSDEPVVCNFIQANQAADADLEAQVEHFYKLDVGETLAKSVIEMSQDDKRVLEIWDDFIKLKSSHYEMDIPFKKTPPDLPDNKMMTEKRLQNLRRRLPKNPDL